MKNQIAVSLISAALLACASLSARAADAPMMAASGPMSSSDYKAAKKKSEMDYKAAKKECELKKGAEERDCKKAAKAAHEQAEKDLKAMRKK